PGGTVSSAIFTNSNGSKTTYSYTQTGCTITQNQCTNGPQYKGTFLDPDTAADASQSLCSQRPQQWAAYCGDPVGTVSTAVFISSTGQTTTYSSEATGCTISQSKCVGNPKYAGT